MFPGFNIFCCFKSHAQSGVGLGGGVDGTREVIGLELSSDIASGSCFLQLAVLIHFDFCVFNLVNL